LVCVPFHFLSTENSSIVLIGVALAHFLLLGSKRYPSNLNLIMSSCCCFEPLCCQIPLRNHLYILELYSNHLSLVYSLPLENLATRFLPNYLEIPDGPSTGPNIRRKMTSIFRILLSPWTRRRPAHWLFHRHQSSHLRLGFPIIKEQY
jgi:hypothetical protein